MSNSILDAGVLRYYKDCEVKLKQAEQEIIELKALHIDDLRDLDREIVEMKEKLEKYQKVVP